MNIAPVFEQEKRLESLLGEHAGSHGASLTVSGICMNSRQVRPGWLFLACRGGRAHGLEFLREAVQRGAKAVAYDPAGATVPSLLPKQVILFPVPGLTGRVGEIAARFFDDPSARMSVTGITGTNGKTSVAMMVAQVLSDWGQPAGVIGTLGYGLYGSLSPAIETTPDPVRIQMWLARFRAARVGAATMEVSSHALDQKRVSGVHFDNAVFTNLSRDHLDYHESMEAYLATKAKLFAWPGLRHAIINQDDPASAVLIRAMASGTPVIGYGIAGQSKIAADANRAQIVAESVVQDAHQLSFSIGGDFGTRRLRSRLIGQFSIYNLLAVLAVLLTQGVDFAEAVSRLSQVRTVPGRMECFGGGRARPLVIVDFAHTPAALMQVLKAVRVHTRGRLWVVFGCGGDRDQGKRSEMGAIAASLADEVILTDDNPRHEDPAEIVDGIKEGISRDRAVQIEHDREHAIALALHSAMPGDSVVIAGKGHESFQIVGDRRIPCSDRDMIRRLIRQEQ